MAIQHQLRRDTAGRADGERHGGVSGGIAEELEGGGAGFLSACVSWDGRNVERNGDVER